MVDQPRPVWLTRADRDMIEDFLGHAGHLVQAWDAAPADATEAATRAAGLASGSAVVQAVLRALGMP